MGRRRVKVDGRIVFEACVWAMLGCMALGVVCRMTGCTWLGGP